MNKVTFMVNLRDIVYEYAIKNAFSYGKANFGSVLSKAISKVPESKKDMQLLKDTVNEVVNSVNAMSKEDINREYSKYADIFEKEYQEKLETTSKANIKIEGAEKGNVITRFPPEPGGYIHIGNAKQCILSDEISKLYDGKIYLYWDDTNPEKCKEQYISSIKEDTAWLGIKFDKEYYASDNIDKIYDYGRKLITDGNAYVCGCSPEEINNNRRNGIECKDRLRPTEENRELFEKMISGDVEGGKLIVRFKGDMKSENSAMRDPTLFRINKAPHYRQGTKYSVWPTYHMNTPILDSINGITDAIRSKEYEVWDSVDKKLISCLGLRQPRIHYEARLNIEGTITKKRLIREFINKGYIKEWDDPRLVTISALKRRGILPEAIKNFILKFGMSRNDTTVKMDMLLSENKRILEPTVPHLFFISNPLELQVDGIDAAPKLKLNPNDKQNPAYREYPKDDKFYISKNSISDLAIGSTVKLKDFINLQLVSIEDKKVTAKALDGKEHFDKIITWTPYNEKAASSVLIPGEIVDKAENYIPESIKYVEGYAEGYATELKVGDIVLFEKFGYCRLDKISEGKYNFIFTSG